MAPCSIMVLQEATNGSAACPQASPLFPGDCVRGSCSGDQTPTVFERDGYRFFFYSNEHVPIHAHVRYDGGEAVFDVEDVVELRKSQGMKMSELSKAQRLAQEDRDLILEKWHALVG